MHCPDFLALYSDYRDGLITDIRLLRRIRGHLTACPRCRRYDRVIQRGVATLREAGLDNPSHASWVPFAPLREAETEPTLTPVPAKFMGALMLLTAMALLVWEARSPGGGFEAAAGEPRPVPVAVANAGVPFVQFVDTSADETTDEPEYSFRTPLGPAFTLYQTTSDR
jgi:hypothetical protein